MGDASLSQDEIDALLMGADDVDDTDFGGGAAMQSPSSPSMNGADYSAVAAALNEAMTTAANSATALVTKNVSIGNAQVQEIDSGAASGEITSGSVIVNVNLGMAQAAVVLDESIAKKISMNMMGSPTEPGVMDEAHLSTLGELVNTIFSSVSNNMSSKVNEDMNPSPPEPAVYQSANDFPPIAGGVCRVNMDLNIDEIGAGSLTLYVDQDSMSRWNSSIGGAATSMRPAPAAPAQQQPSAPAGGGMGAMFGAGPSAPAGPAASVNPVNFPSLTGGGMGQQSQMPSNIDLLMDVQMVMTVELGRTKKYVKDILGLGEGSIIELDKLAGEPVDLLVNGKLIAKGEVVVIDENFGVRVTDIVGPSERLARLTS